mgnify:CR=1 FL=1
MYSFIPLSVPNLKGNELKYVTEAIEAEWVSTGGAMISRFEQEIAAYLGVETATACQSGTAGLHLALLLANVGKDNEVIVPTLTFIAAVNPVRYIGAEPVFMDCDASLCMDMEKLEAFCREECTFADGKLVNKHTHKHIKAIVVVHVFGNMADMESLIPIAKRYNLTVIEDATEALGTFYTEGVYKSKYAGTIGDIGVYSFNGNKIITTGGGGMLVAKDSVITEKARYLSTQAKDDEVNFIHNEVGYNYRMTNLQAALGVAQLEQLESFIAVKKRNYELYKKGIDSINGLSLLPFKYNIRSNYWFNSLYLTDLSLTCNDLIHRLSDRRIQTRPIWGLIHHQKPYQNCFTYKIEKAVDFHHKIVNLPCSSNLTEDDVLRVIECLIGM